MAVKWLSQTKVMIACSIVAVIVAKAGAFHLDKVI